MEYKKLSNGVQMPILGYGVYQVTRDECERCVSDALRAGYRHSLVPHRSVERRRGVCGGRVPQPPVCSGRFFLFL